MARRECELARLSAVSSRLYSSLRQLHNAGGEISVASVRHSALHRLHNAEGEVSTSVRAFSTLRRLLNARGETYILLTMHLDFAVESMYRRKM